MRSVDIEYRNPEVQSPVYLAGSFTDPPWRLLRMECKTNAQGERVFSAPVWVNPDREYQFKFKLGDGDCWRVDKSRPVVTDIAGNQNNLLRPIHVSLLRPPQLASPIPRSMNSSTPIEIVAATAAEVADTAEKLDRTESPKDDDKLDFEMELGDAEEELQTPLFAHESLGAYDFTTADDGLDPDYEPEPILRRDSAWGGSRDFYTTTDDVDLRDPTLEKFPSDRGSIMDTLRRIQSSSSVDHSHFESFLESPRFAPRRQSVDSNDEGSILTSGSLSPTSSRKRDSRLSHSSVGRTKSAVSLRSIAEEGSKQAHDSSNALKIEQD